MKNIIVIACCRSGHNFVMEQIRSWDMGHALLHNFEDVRPENYQGRFDYWRQAGVIDNYFDVNIVIVVRDLLNWWASYLKWAERTDTRNEEKYKHAFMIWKEQVREAFDITRHIPGIVDITYDSFKNDPAIRIGLCNVLCGNYSEKLIDKVPEAGRGSSFDKDIPGSKMKTDLRYQQIMNTPLKDQYLDMLSQHPEAIQLYKTHFNLTAEQKELCNQIKK